MRGEIVKKILYSCPILMKL